MAKGMYGMFGGQYAPEALMIALEELENAYEQAKDDADFQQELQFYLREHANRLSLLYYAGKISEELGGAKIYLEREDLSHAGARKISNVLGQALPVKRMGKTKIIARTDAGQHGVAFATAAALFDMECEVFMGVEDMRGQSLNVFKMELLGATVAGAFSSINTLKDTRNETVCVWTSRYDDTFYVLDSAVGSYPYPMVVRDFQKIISERMKAQCLEKEGHLPDVIIVCMGGGSNTIGALYDLLKNEGVALIGCKATGKGIHTEQHAATIARGSTGVLHSVKLLLLQDDNDQIMPMYSISVGLGYPGVGSEHADLAQSGRVQHASVVDDEAVTAFLYPIKTEGIIPAIESSHALVYTMKLAPTMSKGNIFVATLPGRDDKDIKSVTEYLEVDVHE